MAKVFWYKLLDILHYHQMHLTSPVRGFAVVNNTDWALCFYKDAPNEASQRSWERWKNEARRANILCALPGDEEELAVTARYKIPTSAAQRIQDRIVLSISTAFDAIYYAVGAPHPGGLIAQVACEERRREALLPEVVRGIAAAVRVEQRRRQAG